MNDKLKYTYQYIELYLICDSMAIKLLYIVCTEYNSIICYITYC